MAEQHLQSVLQLLLCLCGSWGTKGVDSHTLLSHHLLSCPQVSIVLLAVKPGQPPPYFPAAAQQSEQQTPEVSSLRGSKLCPVQATGGLGEKDRKIRVGGVRSEPHPQPWHSRETCVLLLICFCFLCVTSFAYSSHSYLLSTCCGPSSGLGAMALAVNQVKHLSLWGRSNHKQSRIAASRKLGWTYLPLFLLYMAKSLCGPLQTELEDSGHWRQARRLNGGVGCSLLELELMAWRTQTCPKAQTE